MVLDSLSREGADSLDYDRLIKQWTQLLASHEHDEVGQLGPLAPHHLPALTSSRSLDSLLETRLCTG